MRNHFRIKEGLIHKRFIFFIITIAIPRLPTLLLISLIKVSRHYIPRKIASLHPFSDIFMIAYESKKLGGSDRKSTRLNSSHVKISYAVFCLTKKNDNDS